MPDQIGPTTPESLVAAAYAKFPERGRDHARAPRPAADVRGEGPRRARRRPAHGRADARRRLRRLPARPRRDAGRDRADGVAAVHAREAADGRGADHGALRPPDPGARRRRRRHAGRARHEPRGLRVPAHGVVEVRHRLLEAGQRDHPPGRARELRVPGRDDDRHRLAHAERGRPRHDRDRCRRRRRGRRDGGLAVQHACARSSSACASPARCRAGPRRRTSS